MAENHEFQKINQYDFIKQIGSGSFSEVWLALHKISGLQVAIKIVKKLTLESEQSRTRFTREVSLMKQIDHPFVTHFFEFFEDSDNYYMVLEYVEHGNMLDFINTQGRLSEIQARHYFSQITCVLEYLHKEKFICHRDLKAENILLDKYGNIRITDFGLSNVFSETEPNLSTACGSPAYAAPEMIKGEPYTNAADIWSVGVLLYSMVAGQLPFDDSDTQRLLEKIVYNDVQIPHFFSLPLIDLIKKILSKDPKSRSTIEDIKSHIWFSQSEYASLLQLRSKDSAQPNIDKEIIDRIAQLGIDTKTLPESILNNEFNETSSIYRQFLRQKLTEQMKDLMQNLSFQTPNKTLCNVSAGHYLHPPFPSSTPYNRRQSFIPQVPGLINGSSINQRNPYPIPSVPGTSALQTAMKPMETPIPVQMTVRRHSRPVALKRTINLPSCMAKPQQISDS